jgi:hypothetical protein
MEKETVKLLNVLRRIGRTAGLTAWTKPEPDATQFCVAQYNRVLARLTELEPMIKPLFIPLSESASPEVIRIAARELLAYFEIDESQCGQEFYYGCRPRRRRLKWAPFVLPFRC